MWNCHRLVACRGATGWKDSGPTFLDAHGRASVREDIVVGMIAFPNQKAAQAHDCSHDRSGLFARGSRHALVEGHPIRPAVDLQVQD